MHLASKPLILGLSLWIFVVSVAVVVGIAPQPQNQPSHMITVATKTDDPTAPLAILRTEGIPLYPNSTEVDHYFDERKLGTGRFTLRADASLDDIVSFYKQELANMGWILAGETKGKAGLSDINYLEFTWTNSAPAIAPSRRYMSMAIYTRSKGGTELNLWFERLPDPNRLPLYSDAEQTSISWDTVSDPRSPKRITTYLTTASPDQISTYYRDLLPEYGWESSSSSEGPESTYLGAGGGSNMSTSIVTISATILVDGRTKVQLTVSGTEVSREVP